MKFRSLMTAICVLATANIVSAAPFAYIANSGTKNVTVINTATDAKFGTEIPLPDDNGATLPDPYAYSVAVGASGQYVYVGIQDTKEIAVIDTATNTVVKRIGLGGDSPGGLAVNAAETRLYVASNQSNTLIVIDITGIKDATVTTMPEVGRVTVHDLAMSNPEGVVLSPDGLKAYVANSSKGSIAEISVDETSNIYTRTNLIALGGNAQPMGLTINSTGSKLYAASLNGTASVIDTASRVATDIVVDQGNSISIAADNSKIFAPSIIDKTFTIDGSNNAVSGPYSVPGWPWGSSVTPNGSKLYMTMYGDNSVKVFNTGTNVVDTTIPLTGLAKPISMGDFIGPDFPYVITSSDDNLCSIYPEGAIAVNSFGRTFDVSQTPAITCAVTVGVTPVGSPSSYSFANLTAGNTISAIQIPTGTYYTLSGNWISSVGGCLQSTGAGISCLSKKAKFLSGSVVTLKATTGFQVQSGTWTGACAGTITDTCSITMDADKSFGTTSVVEIKLGGATGPIKNETKGTYHQTLAEATGAATTNDDIRIASIYTLGGLTTGSASVTVKLSGNWDEGFTTQTGSVSMGALTITDVAVIANNLTI